MNDDKKDDRGIHVFIHLYQLGNSLDLLYACMDEYVCMLRASKSRSFGNTFIECEIRGDGSGRFLYFELCIGIRRAGNLELGNSKLFM